MVVYRRSEFEFDILAWIELYIQQSTRHFSKVHIVDPTEAIKKELIIISDFYTAPYIQLDISALIDPLHDDIKNKNKPGAFFVWDNTVIIPPIEP